MAEQTMRIYRNGKKNLTKLCVADKIAFEKNYWFLKKKLTIVAFKGNQQLDISCHLRNAKALGMGQVNVSGNR